ncbi:T9SS type A sorting domain-containing protein [Hymenobacter sp. YC55]|uniref:T9SS type A sorting domain-containing protein n=1 Tax=Hymenobacter sp. YC55 TaxID=3034019 RepID=UPI0023F9A64C|nr:T9SS type A sorting domain-containing protein [Hymenobacter sp. YC55]MDF7814970.1 T9SS type A sorting domain-containing protein [Hymenobacter sp. YC55]
MKTLFTPLIFLFGVVGTTSLQAQTYRNGDFATGTTSKSGITAPAGYTWSEVQNDAGVTTVSNTSAGYAATKASNFTLADDFTVAPAQSLTVRDVSVFAYQSGYLGTTSPFTELYIRIWRGRPGAAGSTIVFGDLTTNRLLTSTDAKSYRIFNSLYPSPSAPGTTRRIWQVKGAVSPALTLGPGTYWVEWSSTTSGTLAHFYVPVTVPGLRQTPGANALQFNPTSDAYVPVVDGGNPDAAPDVTIDFAFTLNDGGVLAVKKNADPTLKVGPVPTTGAVRAEFSALRETTALEVRDALGRSVWQGQAKAGATSATVPMEKLAVGSYFFLMISPQGSSRVRLLKQ